MKTCNHYPRILWVTPWFGNYRVPVYSYLNQYADGNFHLICLKEDTSDLVRAKLRQSLKNNLTILTGEKRITIGNGETTFANSNFVLKWQPGLYRSIKHQRPDVVIVEGFGSWAPMGVLYSLLHHKKLCIFYERTSYIERNTPWFLTLYRRVVGRLANAFLVNGSLTKDYLINKIGVKHQPITMGCMCADSYMLAKEVAGFNARQKTELEDSLQLANGLTYLFVGQLVERKGIRQLLQAWQEHTKNYSHDNLLVVGEGCLYEQLQKDYGQMPSVHILGGIEYNQLYKYYAICDIFFMPTLEDNWCLVVPEAMACGKPVGCSIYNGGTCELVKDGKNGYSFDPYDNRSILEALDKFHHVDLEAMGKASLEIGSNYTPDKVARRIYNTCLESLT